MNIFKVLNHGDASLHEPSMSALLGYFLCADKDHGLGDSFIREFLKTLDSEKFNDLLATDFIDARVSLEEEYELKDEESKACHIDIQISIFDTSEDEELHRIIIENKIQKGATNEKQLAQYYQAVTNKSDIDESKITFVFLTPKSDSLKFKQEYDNLTLEDQQKKYWIHWDADEKSITTIIKQLLSAEAIGDAQPIGDYVRHTLKAFRHYCINTFDPSKKRKFSHGNLGDEKYSAEIQLKGETYRIVQRTSGQIQVFKQLADEEEKRVFAKPVLIELIEQAPELKAKFDKGEIRKNYNTRTIGKQFFKWKNAYGRALHK